MYLNDNNVTTHTVCIKCSNKFGELSLKIVSRIWNDDI